ncbi:FAD-dependent oxidoreductase, partial [Pseudomonas syringae pv. tagetis]
HYLWSPRTNPGNLTNYYPSKAVHRRVHQVNAEQLQPALQNPKFKPKVNLIDELVVDQPRLIGRLPQLPGHSLLPANK